MQPISRKGAYDHRRAEATETVRLRVPHQQTPGHMLYDRRTATMAALYLKNKIDERGLLWLTCLIPAPQILYTRRTSDSAARRRDGVVCHCYLILDAAFLMLPSYLSVHLHHFVRITCNCHIFNLRGGANVAVRLKAHRTIPDADQDGFLILSLSHIEQWLAPTVLFLGPHV
jgi:hypothetical protein